MNEKKTIIRKKFNHYNLEGSSYEIGQRVAELIKMNPSATNFYSSGKPNLKKLGFNNSQELLDNYESYIPGLTEETQGFADSLNVSPEKAIIYGTPHSFQNNCSHMVALPSITMNNHILAGRSYEWNHNEEDLILCTTNVNGKTKHIGFSMLLFGRYEGINNYGLCVTSSGGGGFSVQDSTKGIPFCLAIRHLLENCKDTENAVSLLQDIPTNFTNNYIISDRNGKASLIECLNSEYSIKDIDSTTENQYLISTNHYTLNDKEKYNKYVPRTFLLNSKTRYKTIKDIFETYKERVTNETFREILTKEMPEGVCAHDYKGYFGTIWSVIFDITSTEIEICFGPPTHNNWIKFNLKSHSTINEYEALFPEKKNK